MPASPYGGVTKAKGARCTKKGGARPGTLDSQSRALILFWLTLPEFQDLGGKKPCIYTQATFDLLELTSQPETQAVRSPARHSTLLPSATTGGRIPERWPAVLWDCRVCAQPTWTFRGRMG